MLQVCPLVSPATTDRPASHDVTETVLRIIVWRYFLLCYPSHRRESASEIRKGFGRLPPTPPSRFGSQIFWSFFAFKCWLWRS
jgi:hypothetical protein